VLTVVAPSSSSSHPVRAPPHSPVNAMGALCETHLCGVAVATAAAVTLIVTGAAARAQPPDIPVNATAVALPRAPSEACPGIFPLGAALTSLAPVRFGAWMAPIQCMHLIS